MPESNSAVVKDRLEGFRKNLLDLSLANKLLNFRSRTKQGKPLGRVLEIVGESPIETYRILVIDQKSMSFVGKPDPKLAKDQVQQAQSDGSNDVELTERLETAVREELDQLLATKTPVDQTDLKLNTEETVSALQKKLTNLWRESRISLDERGVNILFLAVGFLEWYESDASQEVRRAPLMLIPATLERTPKGSFRLKWDGGDVGTNLSLLALMQREFGIKLPEIAEGDDPKSYFKQVAKSITSMPRWRVDGDGMALSFFSYAKFLMYRDLDTSSWPDNRKPEEHETLGALLDCGFTDSGAGLSESEFLDPHRPVDQVYEVFDADSSQTLAILESHSGRSMLIEGPPGTGKSQTITNLIAEAIGQGKKVLFIAEKAAALDVVFRRLQEANLGDACLEIHSDKASKQQFYAELSRTVKLAQPRLEQAQADLNRLTSDRDQLNDYCAAVNSTLDKRDIAPRFAIGRLVQLGPDQFPEARHDFSAMASWTQEDFEDARGIVEKLQEWVERLGRPADHPFFGSTLVSLLPDDKADIARLIETTQGALTTHIDSMQSLAGALRLTVPLEPAGLEELDSCARFVSEAPELADLPLDNFDWEANQTSLNELIAAGRTATNIRLQTVNDLRPEALELPTEDALSVLRLVELLGDGMSALSREQQQVILESAAAALNSCGSLWGIQRQLSEELCVEPKFGLWNIEPVAALAKRFDAAPNLEGLRVSSGEWLENEPALTEAIASVEEWKRKKKQYGERLVDGAWDASVDSILPVLLQYSSKPLKFLSKSYRTARKEAAGLFRQETRDSADLISALQAIESARRLEGKVRAAGQMASGLLCDRWRGTDTDTANANSVLAWIVGAHRSAAKGEIPFEALAYFERPRSSTSLDTEANRLRVAGSAALAAIDAFRSAVSSVGIRALEDGTGNARERTYLFCIKTLGPTLDSLRGRFLQPNLKLGDRLCLLEAAQRWQYKAAEILELDDLGKQAFGQHWHGLLSEWSALAHLMEWVLRFRDALRNGHVPPGLLRFFQEGAPRQGLLEAVAAAKKDRDLALESLTRVIEKAGMNVSPESFFKNPHSWQRDRLNLWLANIDRIQELITFNTLVRAAETKGLHESVNLALNWDRAAQGLLHSFERSWYVGVMREAVSQRPAINHFDRTTHEQIIREFRNLDRTVMLYNRRKVAMRHWQQVPRHEAGGTLGWLFTQFNLRRGHKPIRLAMQTASQPIQAIKPVFLMSPLSVAMYLPPDGPTFDLVVFDEASQVKPEDAFGGILRAKQFVVVGDSKQMPPTSFFDKMTGDSPEDEDEDSDEQGATMKELESILSLVSSTLPQTSSRRRDLRWHYRSRHDALIATSNRLFYEERLVVFPNPYRRPTDIGLILRHNPRSTYDRGGSKKNLEEAKQVAMAALKHVRDHPKLTLGIAAFSSSQRDAILDQIDLLRRVEPAFAEFDSLHPFEPLFVKNLENVQGDERDVIFISVGYGRDSNGSLSMNFGPLNRDGGERRLNVLITRARHRCEVFSNIKAQDISQGEVQKRGVSALRTFLSYADTGNLDVPSATGMEPQSPFEEAVLAALRLQGYEVDPQVGSCGFYIDMAVRHPEHRGKYVLAIECDGAKYHSARSARDRDKLRQEVLESRGWRIHRIWSTDWWQNPERELRRAVEAIQTAIALDGHQDPEETLFPPLPEFVELEREEAVAEALEDAYKLAKVDVSWSFGLHEMPTHMLSSLVVTVVNTEAPVHIEEVTRRIREAAGVGRAGNRIQAALATAVETARRAKQLEARDGFLYRPGQTEFKPRSRASMGGQAKRLELVAPEELEAAIHEVVNRSFGISENEVPQRSAEILGFDRTTAAMQELIGKAVKRMISRKKLVREGKILRTP